MDLETEKIGPEDLTGALNREIPKEDQRKEVREVRVLQIDK